MSAKLGEILVRENLITSQQLRESLDYQRTNGGRLGSNLVKLGFVLIPDGLAGAATRHAITRYERDHGLAVNGEVTPALIRRLSAETGITID